MSRKRGRPAGIDSAITRQRIIDVAREHFANKGYEATSLSSLAQSADLAASAVYHYFGGKTELYEAVFDATADTIWSDISDTYDPDQALAANVGAIIESARHLGQLHPHYNNFLALVPMEARLHPEFAHLLERRSKYQDNTFGRLAEIGRARGELAGFDQAAATELLRSLIMGWFFETHFNGSERPGSGDAIVTLLSSLGSS